MIGFTTCLHGQSSRFNDRLAAASARTATAQTEATRRTQTLVGARATGRGGKPFGSRAVVDGGVDRTALNALQPDVGGGPCHRGRLNLGGAGVHSTVRRPGHEAKLGANQVCGHHRCRRAVNRTPFIVVQDLDPAQGRWSVRTREGARESCQFCHSIHSSTHLQPSGVQSLSLVLSFSGGPSL